MVNHIINTIINYFQNQPITKAWIFGSVSRGEDTLESDIDIMVSFNRDVRVGLFKFNQIREDLEKLTGRKVDLVTETSLMPFARESALADRKLIYERASSFPGSRLL